ncbi:response regulator transcription factor [Paenibacillus sp. FSL L8-0470]|uniref:response regulator transcription factor n=1 Tax=unclassified Paenibacillus TaxID=185978 RepID=UPI0030FAEC6D
MNQSKILIVDDESSILKLLKTVLNKEGFPLIDTATTGEQAILACQTTKYDLILLDVMLPKQNGFEICPWIRQTTDAPILFLTARIGDFDKLTGFAVGGDDYITKPFNPLEVIARVRAQLRRYLKTADVPNMNRIYTYRTFQVDEYAGELRVNDITVDCPAQVFQLLLFFCQNPNRVFSKRQLYEQVWGEQSLSDDNTVMVHIHRIRERIEPNSSEPVYLITARGLGYKLVRESEG